ncbi:hypothetical protein [Prevotella sp.]|uniref:hypothetical protein n=1 Tax=Prevotella sp. TaxID=59823 RepID=UPI004026815D
MKRLADILLSLAALLLLAACTDDADVYNTPASSEGNLCVYVPVTREGDEVKSSLDPSNPTYNASVEECQINDLHLYAFPVGDKGTFLSQKLPSPEAIYMLDEHVAAYHLQIKPGTYRVYVVANMNDVLKDTPINTEEDLKDVVLGYRPVSKPGMPVANNIPMIYEPTTKAADGSTTNGNITIDKTPKTVVANLQFTCVKVCLNLVYDPDAPGVSQALKNNGLQITDVKAERLSPETKLVWNGKYTNPSVSDDYAKGFDSELSPSKVEGAYYTSWTENKDNAKVNNKDIVTVDPKDVAKSVDPTKPWLFRATYYLPERYVAKASQQSALKIDGKVASHNNSYNINLGHRQDKSSEVPTFPRGTYYEIVGHIKSLGNINLDCLVGVEDWKPAVVDADFTHTTLWVSKTSAEVKSLQNDYIDYVTNADAGKTLFGCDTEVEKIGGGKLPVIVSEPNAANNRVIFKINPALTIADFTRGGVDHTKGTAKVWIKANNLKKYLDVKYDVSPFFNVDPVDIVIYYEDNSSELTKTVKFTTNLGGIQFPEGWTDLDNGPNVEYALSTANSTINIKCDNTNKPNGTFTITAKNDPGTTTIHTFTVKAIDDNSIEQQIRVTVRPKKGPYRIYMRAINDLVWCKGSYNQDYQHSNMHDEEDYNGKENWNWLDGWYEENNANWANDRSAHPNYHFVYIYTQIGETQPNGSKDPNTTEWYFGKTDHKEISRNPESGNDKVSDWWPGRSMKADFNNPGWYYFSIADNATSDGNNGKKYAETEPVKTIKPGQTLLIFNNATYLGLGFQSHRFTHHNDPGITLFNYEDREGWYLYDPTSDPYYRVYDEKPTVVDVEYTIYTKNEITGWYVNYGVSNDEGTSQFEMKSENPNVENEFKCVDCGNGWYKTILHLKAPKGEYDKNLHLNIKNVSDPPLLFDGYSYPVKEIRTDGRYVIEGWYDGTWHSVCPR